MSEYRKQVGVAVTIALVGAFGLAILAGYSFPTQPGGYNIASQTSSASTAVQSPVTTASQSTTVSTGTCENCGGISGPTSNENATTVLPPAGNDLNWTEAKDVAFSSPSVQSYWNNNVNSTQGYAEGPVVQGPNGSSFIFVTFGVTDSLVVSGNWTSEYSLAYSQAFNVNVTVELTPPSTYQVVNVAIQDLPNFNQSISFTSQQMQIIQVALSNSTVKQDIPQSQYYVQSVTYFPPSGNDTFAGDYLVDIDRVSGSCVTEVSVNPTTNSVVLITYSGTKTECS